MLHIEVFLYMFLVIYSVLSMLQTACYVLLSNSKRAQRLFDRVMR